MSTDSDIKLRFKKMIGVQSFGTLITFIDRYASVPILTYFWGLPLFGEWLLMRIIPMYLSMFEEGFPSAAGNQIVPLMAQGKQQEARNLYASTVKLINYISILIVISICAALYYGSPKTLLNIQTLSSYSVIITVLLTTLDAIFIFRLQLLYALYRSDNQQIYWQIAVQVMRLLEFLYVVLAVCLGGGVVVVAGGIALISFCGTFFLQFHAKKHISLYQIKPSHSQLTLLSPILKSGFGFMLIPFSQALNIQGFMWLIGYVISPSAAAIFNIYRTYSRIVFQIGDVMRRALWPELTVCYAHNQLQLFAKLLFKSIVSTIVFSFILCVIMYYLADMLIPYWTLNIVEKNQDIIGLLLVIAFIGTVKHVTFTALLSINKHISLVILEIFINIIAIFMLIYTDYVSFLSISFILIMIEAFMSIFVFSYTRSYILLSEKSVNS